MVGPSVTDQLDEGGNAHGACDDTSIMYSNVYQLKNKHLNLKK